MTLAKDLWLAIALDFRKNETDRATAVARLADSGDREVVPALAALFAETEGRLRSAIVDALDRLSAVELLSRLLKSGDAELRTRAAELLGPLGAPTALPALLDALRDAVPRVRELAASALARIRDARAMPFLEKLLLADPEADVRGAAAQAIAELDDPRAIEALERAARHERDEFTIILIERSIYHLSERAAA